MTKKIKSQFIFEAVIFAAALVITLPLRTIQYMNNMEEYTGFYKDVNANVLIWAAILVCASLYFIAAAFISREKISLETRPKFNPGAGICSALAAAGIAISAVQDYLSRNADTSEYTVSSTASPVITSVLSLISLAFAVLSVIYFGVLAINLITKKDPGKVKVLSLFPVLWSMMRIIIRITRTISYLRVSDLALEMIALCCLVIFFMSFAEANSGVNAVNSEWKIVGLGLAAALLTLNCFIPRLVLVITGRTEYMYVLSKADVSDIAIALFILATVYLRIRPKDKEPDIVEVTEATAGEAEKAKEETETEIPG